MVSSGDDIPQMLHRLKLQFAINLRVAVAYASSISSFRSRHQHWDITHVIIIVMRASIAIASLLATVACVSATSNSRPVLAFTSAGASSLQLELPTDSSLTGFIDSLFADKKASPACKLDAIALVEAENLDRDTFASLRHSSTDSLRARSLDAPSQITFDVAPVPDAFNDLASRFAKACAYGRAMFTTWTLNGTFEALPSTKDPHYVLIRAGDLRQNENQLLRTLESLDEDSPRNLVIIAPAAQFRQHGKRQYVVAAPSASNGNWVEPEGGIFARYQLFSTPLILTLLLMGGLMLPIVYFAVSQLAQVQTPDQMGVRKDPISGDKKTQ
ncbi:hypothetical protein PHSY_004257 [Pseudozyma hubeiensis SY62]|uniref:Protein BIG1 n=1 Tax=Pseudozyma hubeiensis (strain SY62) TaxID=1305764 RepID=R9P5R9_PSEHS|nr:hypothetical protein PHSY_004257 [Pseudozyma hubeiensis SY62]GAC96674.1 hypothetical protein PHSY_004257 [Pseudozyma hubeiensis SY62]